MGAIVGIPLKDDFGNVYLATYPGFSPSNSKNNNFSYPIEAKQAFQSRPSLIATHNSQPLPPNLLEKIIFTKQKKGLKDDPIFSPTADELTVGDIVRVHGSFSSLNTTKEGVILEKLSDNMVNVEFGDTIRQVSLHCCELILRIDDFEVGDKVEARPNNSTLFYVGRVVQINPDQTLNVLMDGSDDDYEYNIPKENCRKLMSRRTIVRNRWRKAFMMVIAANFFRRINFNSNYTYVDGKKVYHDDD